MNDKNSEPNRLEELESRVKHLEDVNRFALEALDMVASLTDFQPNINKLQQPTAILCDARSRIKRLFPFSSITFYLVNETDADFYLSDCEPKERSEFVQGEVDCLIDNGTFGWALRENRAVLVSTRDFKEQIVLHVMSTSSRIRGMFVGVIESGSVNIPDISLSLLSILLLNSANALESFELYKMISDINKDLERKVKERTKQLEYHALHDPLTDLPNRTLIFDRMEYEIKASRRHDKEMALLLIDLDRFKDVNDTLGHFAGDKLLVEFGHRLRLLNRESDTVARLGGDEFGVFLPEVSSNRNAVDVARRILGSLEEPFVIEDRTIDVDASIGIALIPEHGRDKETIFRKADVAMYDAKRNKKGFAVFDSTQDESSLAHLTLMGELRKALDNQELVLYYQPKVEMASGRICGVEALMRWNNSKRGFVPPNEFIPVAEQGGLIRPLTLRSLQLAIFQEKWWLDSGLEIPVAVNLSAVSLQDAELPDQIAAMLEEHHVPAKYLELEITESAIMTTPDRGLEVLQRLDEMGITLSIDDFGTGYSSLAYLKKLPVRTIKIDLTFVVNIHTDERDTKIVRAIVELGHNLGLQVIAEGVEKQETWDKLHSLGCNMAQGYLIGRPLPADGFSCWLKTAPWKL